MRSMSRRLVHPIVPLSLLEAIRSVDLPTDDGLGELDPDLAAKRLGLSRTVARQIIRYTNLARKRTPVAPDEVVGLLRLVGRRTDAERVFADAGRRAAKYASSGLSLTARLTHRALPAFVRSRFGLVLARRALARSFGAAFDRDGTTMIVKLDDPPSAHATPEGSACALYGSAVVAVLQTFTETAWVVSHPACRARGASSCHWHTQPENGRSSDDRHP